MRAHSSLARLQQLTTISIVAAAIAWAVWRWPQSLWQAIAGFVLVAFGYSIVLALEFFILRWVARGDPAPTPSWSELARAWWGETVHALRVFAWRQPFRWRAVPDQLGPGTHGRRGIVFVHGFVCNRGFWTPWMLRVRDAGHAFVAVNLEPVFGSIEDYVPIIDDAVDRVAAATGMPPLIVCHSMGGLAARAWLRSRAAGARVWRLVTIGSPHRGTWLGRFSHLPNGIQMRLDGDWLRELGPLPEAVPVVCWYTNCDNIVFPPSTATLPGADNRLVRGVAHVQLAFVPEVIERTLLDLERSA